MAGKNLVASRYVIRKGALVFWKSTEVCGRMLLRDFQLGSREKPDLLHVLQSIIALRYSVVLVFLGSNGYLVVLSEQEALDNVVSQMQTYLRGQRFRTCKAGKLEVPHGRKE